jgi:RNA polymerase sigma factor (sigma-70 family)
MSEKLFTFEDKIEEIDEELSKKRYKWFLSSMQWLDYDDVSQIIRKHIHIKWEKWDQQRPFRPWVKSLILNQIRNLQRNIYFNFSRPCLSCALNDGESIDSEPNSEDSGSCSYTKSGKQCSECPIYEHWEKTKKSAFQVKVPVPIEKHENTEYINSQVYYDIENAIQKLKKELKKELEPRDYKVFKMRFIEGKTVKEVAKELNFTTNEVGREAGYKQVKNIENMIKSIAKELILKRDII